ncbi:MAG: general stress protein, partial [Anaerolineae bacterium]|nr:general stress protein [Anaerolineae bacterium]
MRTVVGLFETRDQARQAVSALRNAGFMADDISVVMRDRSEAQQMAQDVGAGDATAAGVVGGGLLGGLAGLLVGIGALAIPGIGPLIAAGPLAATLAGGAIGAVTGGLLGALVDAGVPEDEARYYQSGVERGGILLSVRVPDNREREARQILQQSGMQNMDYHRGLWEQNPNYEYDPYKEENADKTLGGSLAGGVAGAAIGTAVAGPIGTVVGGAIGGATGAAAGAAADTAEKQAARQGDSAPDKTVSGSLAGGATGAAIGTAVAGPIGTVV